MMKIKFKSIVLIIFILIFHSHEIHAQEHKHKFGNLFIIGGGERPDYLVEKMLSISELKNDDYIVILPMASANPEKGIKSIKEQLEKLSENKVIGFNFNNTDVNENPKVDSVAKAKLIYVVGGSQRRFMDLVKNTALEDAIKEAYNNGSTIAGTSAGAAIMSEVMITGQHMSDSKTREFKHIRRDSVKTETGLGLLPQYNVIDQHFIRRSRFNRIISLLGDLPSHQMIGIDESTALIINRNKAEVVGENQVVVLSNPQGLAHSKINLIRFENIDFALYSAGDTFHLK